MMAVIWPQSLKSDDSSQVPLMVHTSHRRLGAGSAWALGEASGLGSSEGLYTNAAALEIHFRLKSEPLGLINKLHTGCI